MGKHPTRRAIRALARGQIHKIHLAVIENDITLAKQLIQNRNDMNKTARNGATPLHLACLYGRYALVKLLLESKADYKAEDFDGVLPIYYARAYGMTKYRQYFRRLSRRKPSKSGRKHIMNTIRNTEGMRAYRKQRDHPRARDFFYRQGGWLAILTPVALVDVGNSLADKTAGFISAKGSPFPKMMAISGWTSDGIQRPGLLDNATYAGLVRELCHKLGFPLPNDRRDNSCKKPLKEHSGRWRACHVEKQLTVYWLQEQLLQALGCAELEVDNIRRLKDIPLQDEQREAWLFLDHHPCRNCVDFIALVRKLSGLDITWVPRPFLERGSRSQRPLHQEQNLVKDKEAHPEQDDNGDGDGNDTTVPDGQSDVVAPASLGTVIGTRPADYSEDESDIDSSLEDGYNGTATHGLVRSPTCDKFVRNERLRETTSPSVPSFPGTPPKRRALEPITPTPPKPRAPGRGYPKGRTRQLHPPSDAFFQAYSSQGTSQYRCSERSSRPHQEQASSLYSSPLPTLGVDNSGGVGRSVHQVENHPDRTLLMAVPEDSDMPDAVQSPPRSLVMSPSLRRQLRRAHRAEHHCLRTAEDHLRDALPVEGGLAVRRRSAYFREDGDASVASAYGDTPDPPETPATRHSDMPPPPLPPAPEPTPHPVRVGTGTRNMIRSFQYSTSHVTPTAKRKKGVSNRLDLSRFKLGRRNQKQSQRRT
ncbi:hypothetical protein NKR23_g2978 [Pleurostoma richardsiae]|uniref:Single-strand DNA deaminase toxin A-like C-terminal domain-containing protein n=1 Tax=Pleurostoma richardsiae TaxID=41990 RepID=A0AA38S779_9PEZI|nr:hypothetical protein NKR23_g2978 [Pleurostoma richardsiae]